MQKLHISMLVPGMKFNADSLTTEALGGSETAGLSMAMALAKRGHKVYLFCNTNTPGDHDGVIFSPVDDFLKFAPFVPHDVCIVQRAPHIFSNRINAKLNILWQHDLAMGRDSDGINGVMWNVDRVAVLSEYMKKQYHDTYGIPNECLWQTRNGIDLSMVPASEKASQRDRKKLMYSARPERGLDMLLKHIFPKLLEADPEFTLHIAAYNNQVPEWQSLYTEIAGLIKNFGDRIQWLGFLSKPELYRHYSEAGCYVYPTPSPRAPGFNEISCITAMECMACGLPFVGSNRGAIAETLHDEAAFFIDGDPWKPEVVQEFVDSIMMVSDDDTIFKCMSEAGRVQAEQLTWDALAEDWETSFVHFIAENNTDRVRLARHFIRHSDIIVADKMLRKEVAGEAQLKSELRKHWGFAFSQDKFRQQYEDVAATHEDVFESSAKEQRYKAILKWLHEHPDTKRVLDFGCAHGSYAINLSNQVDAEFIGVDIAQGSVDLANEWKPRSNYPERLTFLRGDHDVDLSSQKPFDLLILAEVLEHVPDPGLIVDTLEKWLAPDAHVLITVPSGPWEFASYNTYPYRCHLWEFDLHDLHELFANKKKRVIDYMATRVCELTGEPLGHHFIVYSMGGGKCEPIDIERKIKLQRPRQTVSANIIAGPGSEDTLRWCLRSIRGFADEIVIANTGMNDAALAIAKEYGVILVNAPSPLDEGFETPRNIALDHSRMDWILWIDTDESLLGAHQLNKYLRENRWNGYGIRQHHFTVDSDFEPDMPVRLFRNRKTDGEAMRFYGMIHEHPELGLNKGPGQVIVLSDVHIPHLGYLSEDIRQQRFWRNLPLLEKDKKRYPDRLLQKHFICRDNMHIVAYMMQKGARNDDHKIVELCNDTVTLYREHFLGKPGYINIDSLQYYSQALRILGIGVDVNFDIVAGRDGVGNKMNGGAIRFETEEDLQAELSWRAKQAVERYLKPGW